MFLHTNTLGDWKHYEVIFFVAGGLLLDAIFMTFIARNIWEFPRLINKGELDFQIIRPVSTLFFVMTRHFELSSFLNIVVASSVLFYAASIFPEPLSFLQILGFIFLLFNGLVLMIAIRLFTVLPVFWTHSDFGFHMLFMSLEQVMERPEVIFRGFTHLLFTTVLPFLVMTSFPARWFFGRLPWWEFVYAILLSGLFMAFTIFIWKKGLRVYSSASS